MPLAGLSVQSESSQSWLDYVIQKFTISKVQSSEKSGIFYNQAISKMIFFEQKEMSCLP